MQDKLIKLEQRVSELTYEIKSLVKTQQDIADTLREFKGITTNIALIRQDAKNVKDDVQILFDRHKEFKEDVKGIDERVKVIETTNATQGIKVGGIERFIWLIVTGTIAAVVGFYKGGS